MKIDNTVVTFETGIKNGRCLAVFAQHRNFEDSKEINFSAGSSSSFDVWEDGEGNWGHVYDSGEMTVFSTELKRHVTVPRIN